MSNKINLAILTGGSSSEREISIKSCDNVIYNIDNSKYNVKVYNLPEDDAVSWIQELIADNIDIVFSTLHGGKGENGDIQGLLKSIGIPFVGSGVLASSLCIDKAMAKIVMEANHIQTAQYTLFKIGSNILEYAQDIRQIGFPLIVKPNRGGSSIGIEVVNNNYELEKAINSIIDKYNDDVLIEKFIKGREITCGIIEDKESIKVMPVLDVKKTGDIFNFADKYEASTYNADESNMPDFLKDMVRAIAIKAYKVLKCKGYACVDMIVDKEQIYVIEVNTLPGLTSQSLITRALVSLNISFSQFIDMLISFELDLK